MCQQSTMSGAAGGEERSGEGRTSIRPRMLGRSVDLGRRALLQVFSMPTGCGLPSKRTSNSLFGEWKHTSTFNYEEDWQQSRLVQWSIGDHSEQPSAIPWPSPFHSSASIPAHYQMICLVTLPESEWKITSPHNHSTHHSHLPSGPFQHPLPTLTS